MFCLDCGEPAVGEEEPAPETFDTAEAPARLRGRWWQIGVAVAVGAALVWLLSGWYLDESHAGSYRQGVAAVAAHDWGQAAAQFHAAESYADAPARAAAAEQALRDRAQLQQAIPYAQATGNWREVLALLDKLLQIDPTNPQALADRADARDHLLDGALAGTLYSITSGPQAGLYLNLAGHRDVKLPGSDGRSRPRALSPTGDRLVYDRPRYSVEAGGAPNGEPRDAVLAAVGRPPGVPADGQPLMGVQVLPPAIIPGLHGEFAAGNLFWQTLSTDGLGENSLIYYRFADNRTFFVQASGQWRYVAAKSAATGTILRVDPPALGQGQPLSLLTIAKPGEPSILDMHLAGWVTTASFSADGRYLLYTMQDGSISTSLSTSLYFVDLPPPPAGSPQQVFVQFRQSIISADPTPPHLGAEFVPDGPRTPTEILVTVINDGEQTLTLDRLSDGMVFPIGKGSAPLRPTTHVFSNDGTWLAYMADLASGTRLILQRLQASTPPLTLAAPGFRGANTSIQFSPGSRYLVYRVPGQASGTTGTFYSLALSGLNPFTKSTPALRPLYLGTVAAANPDPTLVFAPGGDMLLYLDAQRTLHAAAYDGSLDFPLTFPGPVGGVWSFSP